MCAVKSAGTGAGVAACVMGALGGGGTAAATAAAASLGRLQVLAYYGGMAAYYW
jgi:hypothetical protein